MKTQIIAIIPRVLKEGDHGRRKREESNDQVAGLTSEQRVRNQHAQNTPERPWF